MFFNPVCLGSIPHNSSLLCVDTENPTCTLKKNVNQFRLVYEILTVANKIVFYPVTLLNSKHYSLKHMQKIPACAEIV